MKSHRSLPISGRWGLASLVLAATLLAGCNYGFRGGGGFPGHIRTIYVEPFDLDREVSRFELRQELYDLILDRVPSALGVQPAGADVADAVLRGRITRYDDRDQNYRGGEAGGPIQVLENRVEIVVQVEIEDRRENVILWDHRSLRGEGTYLRDSQTDRDGQRRAMETLVQLIIDGAQSQW